VIATFELARVFMAKQSGFDHVIEAAFVYAKLSIWLIRRDPK